MNDISKELEAAEDLKLELELRVDLHNFNLKDFEESFLKRKEILEAHIEKQRRLIS